MITVIPDVLDAAQLQWMRQKLANAAWQDGSATAGNLARDVKKNRQLAVDDPIGLQCGARLVAALQQQPLFVSAGLPLHILPPMFNCYSGGETYGTHIDGAIRRLPCNGQALRTDLSCTLFLSEPDAYVGGVLEIEDTYGQQAVKLPAGHCVMYPSTSLHRVSPVTQGERVCAFFWLQSMVRDDGRRSLLFDLDCAMQNLAQHGTADTTQVLLAGVYHNLLRQWAEI